MEYIFETNITKLLETLINTNGAILLLACVIEQTEKCHLQNK